MALPIAKRKRSGGDLLTRMRKKASTETRRKATYYDEYARELGIKKEQEVPVLDEKPRRSIMMVLRDMIVEKSPLLVITSAEAEAEADYEDTLVSYDTITTLLPEPKVQLWPHQEQAVRFIGQRETDIMGIGCRGLMLCDDMGLGKTLDTLMYIYRDTQQRQRQTGRRFNGVSLIVIPGILLDTWVSEIEKSFPPNSLRYIKMMGDTSVPDYTTIENCTDIIFTTYTMVSLVYKALVECKEGPTHRYEALFQIKFLRVVPDEAHYIANPISDRFRAMKALTAISKWYNTGTPVQNSYKNIYAAFDFIRVQITGILTTITPTVNGNSIRLSADDKSYMKTMLDKVMLRRLKDEIMGGIDRPFLLSGVDRQVVYLDFRTRAERVLYLLYAKHGRSRMTKKGDKPTPITQYEGEYNANIASTIQLMRQCCLDFHILRLPILPNGMLLGYNTTLIKTKPTSFNERLFYDDSCEYAHLERDNAAIEYNAFKHNKKTLYTYESGNERRLFEWHPYRDTKSIESLRFLYTQCYSVMSSAAFDGTYASLRTGIPLEWGDNQVETIYEDLLERMLPRYSTKQMALLEYIWAIEDPTDKVTICSDSVEFLRAMAICLNDHSITSRMVVGKTGRSDLDTQIGVFRRDPSIKVLLLSLKKGCVGLNIPESNHMLFSGPWWNPQGVIQAECRLQRIGQRKKVYIRQFVIRDSMEEYMLGLSHYKKTIADELIDDIVEEEDDNDDTLDAINGSIDDNCRSRLFDYNLAVQHM